MQIDHEKVAQALADGKQANVICDTGWKAIEKILNGMGYVEPPKPVPKIGEVWKIDSGTGACVIVKAREGSPEGTFGLRGVRDNSVVSASWNPKESSAYQNGTCRRLAANLAEYYPTVLRATEEPVT